MKSKSLRELRYKAYAFEVSKPLVERSLALQWLISCQIYTWSVGLNCKSGLSNCSDFQFSLVSDVCNFKVYWQTRRGAVEGYVHQAIYGFAKLSCLICEIFRKRVNFFTTDFFEVSDAPEGVGGVVREADVKEACVLFSHELMHVVARRAHHQELRPVKNSLVDKAS